MPKEADAGHQRANVELVELRVLDGPNRFGTRPAVKLEFRGEEAGEAGRVAAAAAEAVRGLHAGLELHEPRVTTRHSVDRLRTAIAFPWRRRTISQAIGAAAARVALGRTEIDRETAALRAVALGPLPNLPRARVPIVAVTGTNGKSTTTRLIAHVASGAGRTVGMTNSDGIFVRGDLIEAGDWTGFGGAARVLAERDVDLAVLETARGGILLRGIGYASNDVSVVTNISADHLGLQGIDTLEELAEVKGTVVRITKADGWAVLNADDDLVWEMRRRTRASIYAFSLSARSDRAAATVEAGGRAAVLERGWIVLRSATRPRIRLVEAAALPVTFAGLSQYNVANALGAAAACDALGMDADTIAEGLTSFSQDASANPGRLNLFSRRGTYVLVDFAHNEAGMVGLMEVARAVAGDRSVRLAFGTAGDRTDEILHRLGFVAGGADDVVIAEKEHYLRGRDLEEMNELLRAGARDGGYRDEVPSAPSELDALRMLVDRARRGDVCVVMAHSERAELFAWLEAEGFGPVGHEALRRILARHG